DRSLLAATFTWTGAAGGGDITWSTANNWNRQGAGGPVPAVKDMVVIDNPPGNADSEVDAAFGGEIDKLRSRWNRTLWLRRSLTVNNDFTFQEGTINGAGNLILKGSNSVWITGNMSGAGTTIITSRENNTAELKINTGNVDSEVLLDQRKLQIAANAK